MRVTVGAVAVLGLAVAVAGAQPPAPRERAAVLLPPQALPAGEVPLVARGVAEELPPAHLASTPVRRTNNPAAHPPNRGDGPAWLTGADPNVHPAAGLGARSPGVRQLSPAAGASVPREQPSFVAKGLDKFKGAMPAGPKQAHPGVAHGGPQPEPPTASTPFRGTTPNGAPVYAGPPAYRWYGWGSVTPGANAFAPNGQYPKASANWYAITGATPGAFPVPVMNPARPAPGAEPPSYALTKPPGGVQPVASLPAHRSEAVRHDVPVGSKFMPGTDAPPVAVPTITAPPGTRSVAVAPPPAIPYVPPVEPTRPVAPVTSQKPLATGTPSPLPTSVTEEPRPEVMRWQPSREPAVAPPGTWTPAGAPPARPSEPQPNWSGGAAVTPVVARGQLADEKPDPLATLIRQLCQGRAEAVEVRWVGSKRIAVCFEARGAADAQKLVSDISKRPELGPYQIDFCVVVK